MPPDLLQHWRLMYENKYLGAWNLCDKAGRYREASATIADVKWEIIIMEGGRKEQKLVLYFAGKRIPLILSKTNGKTLESMFGPDPKRWIGKPITLYARDMKIKGQAAKVLTIRGASRAEELKEELAGTPEPHAETLVEGDESENLPGVE